MTADQVDAAPTASTATGTGAVPARVERAVTCCVCGKKARTNGGHYPASWQSLCAMCGDHFACPACLAQLDKESADA